MVSLFTYIVVLSLGALFLSYSPKKYNIWAFIGLGIVIIFAAGRYYVGTDYLVYYKNFARYASRSWEYFFNRVGSEWLFHFINKITYSIGGRVLTWGVIAAMVLIPVYATLKDQYKDMSFGAALLVFLFLSYTTAFNISREYIAIAIVFWGLKYVFENKFFKFALCVILATFFHKTAIIAFVFWIFWSHKNNAPVRGKAKGFMILLGTIIILFFQPVIAFLSSAIPFFAQYAGFAVEDLERANNREFWLNLFVLCIFLWNSRNFKEKDPRLEYMLTLLIVANIIGLTGFVEPRFKRIALYFSCPAETVLFGYLPSCMPGLTKQSTTFMVYLYVIAYFTLSAYILGQGNLIPYTFDLTGI